MQAHQRSKELVSCPEVPSEDVCLHLHAIQRAVQGPHPLLALPEKVLVPVQQTVRLNESAEHLDRLNLVVTSCVEDAQHFVGVFEGSIIFLRPFLYPVGVRASVFVNGVQLEMRQ